MLLSQSPSSAAAAATVSGRAGTNCFSSLRCSAGGGSASRKSCGIGQARRVRHSTAKAFGNRGWSRSCSHTRPSVRASNQTATVSWITSAAGVRSRPKHISRLNPSEISRLIHSAIAQFLQCQ